VTELRGGLFIHDAAIVLAMSLEARGHVIAVKDGKLTVTNGSTLTKADIESIKHLKTHLIAVATYQAPEPN
jgi:hypothetical protein